MSLLDLLESISGAPRSGMGFGDGAGGGLPATGGSSPPMCQPPPPDFDDGPDYTDPRIQGPPMTMDDITGPPADDISGSSDTNQSGAQGQDGESVGETTNRWKKERVVIDVLGKYGRWMNRGTTAERALKFLTGLVVVPIGAVLACGEDTVKTYIPTVPGAGSGR